MYACMHVQVAFSPLEGRGFSLGVFCRVYMSGADHMCATSSGIFTQNKPYNYRIESLPHAVANPHS